MACDHVQNDARVLSEVILVTHLRAQVRHSCYKLFDCFCFWKLDINDGHLNIVSTLTQLSLVSSFRFLFFFFFVSVSLLCVSVPWPCYICLWPLKYSVTLASIPYSLLTFILYFLSPSVYKSLHPSLISSQHILTGQRANVGYSVLMAEH